VLPEININGHQFEEVAARVVPPGNFGRRRLAMS
jgi:hypothetical protein